VYNNATVKTPLDPPIAPQLARPQKGLPEDEGWGFEPKLDGFRAIVFCDGDEHLLQSRNGKPLDRYFPEVSFPPGRYVLDGELVIAGDDDEREQFGSLQQRIHPAASRVNQLAESTPAMFVAFDLLADGKRSLLGEPFQRRRELLEAMKIAPFVLIEHTLDRDHASEWLKTREGVIAKKLDAHYRPGERVGMLKIRRERTLDCVVIGWREHAHGGAVGSLILGLYEPDGDIRHVGHSAGFPAKRARELVDVVTPLETGERGEPSQSRWSRGEDTGWRALRPELVAEVKIDHASDGRIRHGAKLVGFRDDKPPRECTVDQLDA
jgi:ATP-dependent DNA ligase